MFGSRKENVFKKVIEGGLVTRVEMRISHGYGFRKSGRGTIKTTREYTVFIGCDPVFETTQYGDLTRCFTSKAEALKYARMTLEIESDNQSPVRIVHNATETDLSKIGIHLRDATQWDFQDALETAVRDNFPAIYVHSYHSNWYDDDKRENVKPLSLVTGKGGAA